MATQPGDPVERASQTVEQTMAAQARDERRGQVAAYTCPECGGALWELRSGKLFKFRCHVGHAYTSDGLISEQTRDLESALWTALRALEENAALRRRMAKRARTSKFSVIAEDYDKQAVDAEARASLIRGVLMAEEPTAMGGSSDTPRPEWDGKLYGSKQAQERRKGGETGVRSVHHLEGAAVWKAAEEGRWSKSLMKAALGRALKLGTGAPEDKFQ